MNRLNWSIFNGGGGGGGKKFGPQKFRFPTIIIFVIFWKGGKIH